MRTLLADNYKIYIGDESLSVINSVSYSKVAILVDQNTKRYCLPILLDKLELLQDALIIEVEAGEQYKNIDSCNFIWNSLIEHHFDRDSLLINLGGGVICDMGGYCASTYKRGIAFMHIPTTLLAMIDASIGGKLGVNFHQLKNQVGIFNNPEDVIIFSGFLKTLDKDQLHSAFGEIIKHVLVSGTDKDWNDLKSISLENVDWEPLIFNSISIKLNVVLQDPFDIHERRILNFGHTFGHAIESYYLSRGDPILHGEAVLMGIILESDMSNLEDSDKLDIKEYILSNFALPHFPPRGDIVRFIMHDKKNKDDKINFSLLDGIGTCSIDHFFTADEL